MDFLDPKAKKNRNIRLMIGYILVAIVILTSSTILVFQAYGFDVDRKTGEVIQNGLVYLDSAPDGAQMYLNGTLNRNQTNARLTLPEGRYDVKLAKEGYRDWQRTFTLQGGSIQRITYPLLILNDLTSSEITTYSEARPLISTQSPDRRWLLISNGTGVSEFTEYDLNNLDEQQVIPRQRLFQVPPAVFTAAEGQRSYEVVEWSNDNRHFLVKHTFSSGFEYVIINRDAPETSFNINQLLGVNPTEISLLDKKFDQWYLYTQEGGILQRANTKKEITTVLQSVVAYKTHDTETILYAQAATETQYNVYLREKDQTFLLKTIAAGPVKLNIARFDGSWYGVIGSDGDKRTYVYRNPFEYMVRESGQRPAPVTVMQSKDAPISAVLFSTNTRFIMSQSDRNIGVYDAEKNETFTYSLPDPLDQGTEVSWMAGL